MEKFGEKIVKEASRIIKSAMDGKYPSGKELQADYFERFKESIAPATLTNVRQGHESVSLKVYANLAELLGVDLFAQLGKIMEHKSEAEADFEDIFLQHIFNQKGTFETRASSTYFDGYYGTFHTYFYQTISGKETLLHGLLTMDKADNGQFFKANFLLYSDDTDDDGKPIEKNYDGYLIYSLKTSVISCLLLSARFGEICLLKFKHFPLQVNDLACRMALAITASAGEPRLPTVHRVYISRKPLNQEEQERLKGHLLMNNSSIIIEKEQLRHFIEEEELPQHFKEALNTALKEADYAKIKEPSLFQNTDSHPTAQEVEALGKLRGICEASRYNKISSRSDEYTYMFYKGIADKKTE